MQMTHVTEDPAEGTWNSNVAYSDQGKQVETNNRSTVAKRYLLAVS